ncbi:MAG: aminopeptidase N [Robiginitomaculum sp.]|nr:MAG: aminopeptidase N [Robiginitomaculum sp.]
MKTEMPVITRLKDYTTPDFKIETIALDFNLEPKETRVRSTMKMHRTNETSSPLHLNGEDIKLISLKVDGKTVPKSQMLQSKIGLEIKNLPEQFILEIETSCNPATNTSLMGLYVSGGRFCTQCEAEGFRKITYFPDRPDMLATYNVRIEANKALYPTLLANGNCVEEGDLSEGRHYAKWEDPFPKPCYLFALVAGKFDTVSDHFITMSGRDIPLDIYVDPGDAPRALYAMDALKRSMKWDEEAFGREYDLDRFMIVAVRDFNFGAMENKGLNIFNSSLLLADEASATDMNFELIESVIAHEYFHNWTGNRITCRDWFQLCLKEGFTVFRDQEFSADQRGAALQRIKDVKALRARQFPEDAGPLSHPVRPASYMKIDNFYTATIYEKGAELIRMLKTLLGAATFRDGCDHYFKTLDGTAATIEQFIECFEHASGHDLSQFMLWYEQAGTPSVNITTAYDPKAKTFDISFKQKTAPTPGQPGKKPLLMPIKMGLLERNGQTFGEQIIAFNDTAHTVRYENIVREPVLSVFRGFSAPVTVDYDQSPSDALIQMRADPDLFNRWEASQALARDILTALTRNIETGTQPTNHQTMQLYTNALISIVEDKDMDMGFKALALAPPANGVILQALSAQSRKGADPLAVHQAIKLLRRAISETGADAFENLYAELSTPAPFTPDALGAGRRALRNTCLLFLTETPNPKVRTLAQNQFLSATNMTEELAALLALVRLGGADSDDALQHFYTKWENTPLVIDKWFAACAMMQGDTALRKIEALTHHSAYRGGNPNRVRALIGGFATSNPERFHHIDGSGYRFFTDNVLAMDRRNPQVAARLLGIFGIWNKLDPVRQSLIKIELARVLASKPSANVLEIATKSLGD